MRLRPAEAVYRVRPVKRLGQHFLVDSSVRAMLIQHAQLSRQDTVLEIGPGMGFLTASLAERAGRVIGVEKDARLASILREKFQHNARVEILEGDVLRVKLPPFNKVVSTPPYYLSSRLLMLLLDASFDLAVLVLQKEFAERLAAKSGTENYGRLTVMVRHRADVQLYEIVSRHAFRPRPKVDSAIVGITKRAPRIPVTDESEFRELVRALFTQRRRRLTKALRHYLDATRPDDANDLIASLSLLEKRVFELETEEFEALSNQLYTALQSRLKSRFPSADPKALETVEDDPRNT